MFIVSALIAVLAFLFAPGDAMAVSKTEPTGVTETVQRYVEKPNTVKAAITFPEAEGILTLVVSVDSSAVLENSYQLNTRVDELEIAAEDLGADRIELVSPRGNLLMSRDSAHLSQS